MDYWTKYFGTGSHGFQISSDEEDMEEFRSEKSVKTGKSAEEIEKFLIDENLSDLERTCLLLSTGQDVQKLCVIEGLPNLLRKQQMDTLCRVIPKLCDVLPLSSVDVQVLASQVLGEAVQEKLIPVHIFTASCLPTVLKQLESRDQAVGKAWLGTVLASISVLPKEDLKRKILTLAVSKGQLSQTVNSRQTSCRIVGEIADRFSSEPVWLQGEVLPLATSLCQDVDSTVRQLMCHQLHILAKALGPQISEESILPELVELLNDEEAVVRVSALESLTALLPLWTQTCLSKQVLPLVKGFYDTVGKSKDWTLLEGVARLLGRLCHGLRGVMSEEQLQWFVRFYRDLPKRQFPMSQGILPPEQTMDCGTVVDPATGCRHLCAFNFPAMALVVGKDAFKTELFPTFESLAKDECPRVRKTIACGFHEVVDILHDKSHLVSHIYQNLLRDSSDEVLSGLVTHLPKALQSFAAASNLSPDTHHPGLPEFIGPLLACDQVASTQRQWRLHCDLLTSLKCVVNCMTSDQIHSKFIPLIQSRITGSTVLPVKKAAGHTLCILIRNNRRQQQRKDLIGWIIKELCKSPSCQKRLLFIEICTYLLELFSFNFFKENVFDAVLQLSHDPVINIRLRLFHFFPTLKAILKLPTDRVLLQNLETTVRKLIVQERESDAAQSIRDAVLEMDRIEVSLETYTRRTYFEADLADQQKEMEEKALLESEEKEKPKQDKLKKPPVKKCAPSPRDVRKQLPVNAVNESKSTASPSPLTVHKGVASKSKSSPIAKTISAPSSTSDLSPRTSSPSHSPSHGGPKSRKVIGGTKGSPPVGGEKPSSTTRNSSASSVNSEGAAQQKVLGTTKSSIAALPGSNVATTSKSTAANRKKVPHNYGLEYSAAATKAKKKT